MTGLDMRNWNIEDAKELFNKLNSEESPTKRVVEMDRPNSAEPFSGADFIKKFDDGIEEQLDMADAVFKSVGA